MEQYEILQEIGQGSTSRVYLVRHRMLGALRAVKCIPKSHPDHKTFLQEGRVLQNLNHPGIPRIYDMEEDAHTFYLIEEYVSGESLQTLRSVQSKFSQESIIGYGIEICNILQYLHEQRPFSLIYLDLKPEHIVVTPSGIKLIDFGAVIQNRQWDSRTGILGTPGFCAPEVLAGGTPGIQADVYGVGAVLYYLLHGKTYSQNEKNGFPEKKKRRGLLRVIGKCLESEEKRYQSIGPLRKDLTALLTKKQPEEPTSLKIAVLGGGRRVGATHFAIGLTSYLNRNRQKSVYQDESGRNVVDAIYEHCRAEEVAGWVKVKNFWGVPDYGPGISLEPNHATIQILDFGNSYLEQLERVRECDRIYFLLGSSPWEPLSDNLLSGALASLPLNVVVQFGLTENSRKVLKEKGVKNCFVMPFFQDIWKPGMKTEQFYEHLWNSKV